MGTHQLRSLWVILSIGLLVWIRPSAAGTPAFDKVIASEGVTVRVRQGAGEPPIGTYTVTVVAAGGRRASITAARNGMVMNAWMTHLNRHDLFEVAVTTRSAGSGSYGALALFEWTGTDLRSRHVAGLSKNQARGYMGHDRFALEDGRIIRRFPVYAPHDPNCCATGGTKRLVYDFDRNRWIVSAP